MGDRPGHPFRGNQHSHGRTGGKSSGGGGSRIIKGGSAGARSFNRAARAKIQTARAGGVRHKGAMRVGAKGGVKAAQARAKVVTKRAPKPTMSKSGTRVIGGGKAGAAFNRSTRAKMQTARAGGVRSKGAMRVGAKGGVKAAKARAATVTKRAPTSASLIRNINKGTPAAVGHARGVPKPPVNLGRGVGKFAGSSSQVRRASKVSSAGSGRLKPSSHGKGVIPSQHNALRSGMPPWRR